MEKRHSRGTAVILTAAAVLLAAAVACSGLYRRSAEEGPLTRQGFFFDTAITITIYGQEEDEELLDGVFEICTDLENTFSPTLENSELYRINHRTEQQIEVSDDMAEVARLAIEWYERTEGKLDFTIAPLLELWDFKAEDASVPDADSIREALTHVEGSAVHLDGNLLSFDREDIRLDFGAFAKGYAADRIKAYLTDSGVESGLINLGGNVLTIGAKPDGEPWTIGIQKPFAERNETSRILECTDRSVVSSGVYERYFEQDGKIYSHILDPDTGYPVENGLWQVTIVSESSAIGDALSTSCMLLGKGKGEELAQEAGAEAVYWEEAQDTFSFDGN